MTQAQVTNAVNQTVSQNNGKVADAGADTKGQCTAPVIKYVEALGAPVPSMANDRADGWGTNFPSELAPYFTHEAYQSGVSYPEGTIMMWNSPHIVIVLSCNGSNTVQVFEQNADPNGSPCHTAERTVNEPPYHEANFVLIPVVSVTPPAHDETIAAGTWNVRSEPNTSASILGVVNGGTVFNTTVVANDWRQVSYEGKTGFLGPKAWAN